MARDTEYRGSPQDQGLAGLRVEVVQDWFGSEKMRGEPMQRELKSGANPNSGTPRSKEANDPGVACTEFRYGLTNLPPAFSVDRRTTCGHQHARCAASWQRLECYLGCLVVSWWTVYSRLHGGTSGERRRDMRFARAALPPRRIITRSSAAASARRVQQDQTMATNSTGPSSRSPAPRLPLICGSFSVPGANRRVLHLVT